MYVKTVPRLFVLEPRLIASVRRVLASRTSSEDAPSSAGVVWSGVGTTRPEKQDAALDAIQKREEQEELGDYISNIASVTYLAGAVAAYLGYIAYVYAF